MTTVDKVIEAQQITRMVDVISLNTLIGEDDSDTELGDLIESDKPTPEDILIQDFTKDLLNTYLEKLTAREQKVIRLRYGLCDGVPYTLEDIGNMYGITRERIRQVEKNALIKLRRYVKKHNLTYSDFT